MAKVQYTYFVTPHHLSIAMGAVISAGFGARILPARSYFEDSGTAMMYGLLRGCGEIIKACLAHGMPYIYIDHAYFFKCRGSIASPTPDTHFRLVYNDRYAVDMPGCTEWMDFWPRWRELGIEIQSFHRGGRNIIVVPMSRYVADYEGVDATIWLNNMIRNLSEHTDRSIIVKPKSEGGIEGLDALFADAHALVAHDSLSAISALIHGVPVFVSPANPAVPMGMSLNELHHIEDPYYPDNREELFARLAWQQWTVDEIRNGTARRFMEDEVGGWGGNIECA